MTGGEGDSGSVDASELRPDAKGTFVCWCLSEGYGDTALEPECTVPHKSATCRLYRIIVANVNPLICYPGQRILCFAANHDLQAMPPQVRRSQVALQLKMARKRAEGRATSVSTSPKYPIQTP